MFRFNFIAQYLRVQLLTEMGEESGCLLVDRETRVSRDTRVLEDEEVEETLEIGEALVYPFNMNLTRIK